MIDEAIECKETGEEKTILFLLCGHGHFDIQAYNDHNSGKVPPYEYPKEKVEEEICFELPNNQIHQGIFYSKRRYSK